MVKIGKKTATISRKRYASSVSKILASVAVPLFLVACSNGSDYQTSSYGNPDLKSTQVASLTGAATIDSSFLALANEMAGEGDHNAAIPLYRRAMRYHPFASEPRVGLGDSLRAIGQYQQAEKAYQAALSRDEQNPRALTGLANAYILLNRPTMAIPLLNDAIALNPRNVEAISSLAVAFEMRGNGRAAMAVYQDGLSIDPNNLKLLNNYGLSLALQSRHGQAIEVLKQAAQHRDADATHRQNLAMAYALAGDEVMSARLLSIDNGPDLTNENLGYFRILASLPIDERFDAVVRQSTASKTDITDVANETYDNNSRVKNITVARLVEVPPEPVAVVEPEPVEENIPPLLGPQGWALQIAAYRKKSELMPGWEKLKKKYFDIIGDLEPRRSEIDLGEAKYTGGPHGFYYRLNAGPLTSLEEAQVACEKIRKQGTDCWVRIPEVKEGTVADKDMDKAEEFRRKVYTDKSVKNPDDGA
ncbi:MAG: tetratricopeptide repeat protein [Emcibacter sp.]|nr:tetratricopeptide repeat protein [Emcibacter sp.]